MSTKQLLSSLPSVDELLKSPRGAAWQGTFPRRYLLQAIRETIDDYRQAILKGDLKEFTLEEMLADIQSHVEKLSAFSLQPVINATGIVMHTNLGRSVLPEDVLENVKRIACGYSNLEYEIEEGKRGKRYSHVQRLLNDITGAESSLIVNNNAAAVFVSLSALSRGKEVIVSRGELVEIGGSFRVPDVMSASGATLVEVGTTNKTHLRDYENAITGNTGMLLKIHRSNFRIIGFTKEVEIDELVTLGRKHGIPVMFDLGSGCLVDLKPYGITIEPTVQEVIKTGADIVSFSGDKLLGGPQGGVIVGRRGLIDIIAKYPLMRAVRIDKLTLSAFEAVLMKYLDEDTAKREIPTLQMLLQDPGAIQARAKRIAAGLKKALGGAEDLATAAVISDSSQSGGGALPEIEFETFAVAVRPERISVNKLEERLRLGKPPIVARIKEDALLLDARTIREREIPDLIKGLRAALI